MKKSNFGQFLLLLLFISFSFFSCEKENENSRLSEKTQVITFAYDCMSTYYLWNKNVPALNLKNEANTDPYDYFEKIRYVDDRWSMLTDDVKSLSESLSGTGTTFGYSLALGTFSDDPDNVFAVVLFTYPGSPAEIAGLKRGDFIIGMNDRPITRDNYTDLFYASNLNLNLGYLQGETVYPGGSVSLQARNMYLNPVNKYKIIEKGNHKIGYLFYTDFLLQSHNELQNVFDYFKQNNVTDVVLDLRYNSGGYVITSELLASILAPASAIQSKAIFNKEIWNDEWTEYFRQEGIDSNSYFTSVLKYEDDNGKPVEEPIRSNMDLSRLYVITGMNTASASESLIIGLAPYLNVITIGEVTFGKFCGGSVFSPNQIYTKPDPAISNWGAYTMLYRFADKDGITNCINGYKPNYLMDDLFYERNIPLGDENEYLLAKALSLILGYDLAAIRSGEERSKSNFRAIPNLKTRSNDFQGKLIDPIRFP